jgi:hypothetical protein
MSLKLGLFFFNKTDALLSSSGFIYYSYHHLSGPVPCVASGLSETLQVLIQRLIYL